MHTFAQEHQQRGGPNAPGHYDFAAWGYVMHFLFHQLNKINDNILICESVNSRYIQCFSMAFY